MKFSILSGAYVNAGDFLIVKRTIELLKFIYKDCEIKEYKRKYSLEEYIEDINNSDALIIAGGPAYTSNLYPDIMPLVPDLSKIKTKIVPIGCGWYGVSAISDYIYKYVVFEPKTMELINKIYNDCKLISCRDWYSVKTLSVNGFLNGYMTGCPAWYDIKSIDKKPKFLNTDFNINKICISDPANLGNIEQAKKIILLVKNKYKNANIKFVFHRRENLKLENKYLELEKFLIQNDIEFVNISDSADGFEVYNDCDLHIGYRVHAHIYNLSIRNLSILIEEDGRGRGVNNALALPKITAYNELKVDYKNTFFRKNIRIIKKKFFKVGIYKNNKYVFNELCDVLNEINKSNYVQYEIAFDIMKKYYQNMINYIKTNLG
ncbi:MAG: polysaccharide pyruvyl transferase family protein [Clostridium sp.]|nr:polysaccharide pyruvyl transferase family protein [Clostridium sp.]MCM1444669.1 polysaccharide pyruvyl transferase family protein [Candidatus Amulumruptor caecigallinarius]